VKKESDVDLDGPARSFLTKDPRRGFIAHSSTDVVLADWLKSQQEEHDKLEDSHLQLADVRRESE
jgi:hypothetical protein